MRLLVWSEVRDLLDTAGARDVDELIAMLEQQIRWWRQIAAHAHLAHGTRVVPKAQHHPPLRGNDEAARWCAFAPYAGARALCGTQCSRSARTRPKRHIRRRSPESESVPRGTRTG